MASFLTYGNKKFAHLDKQMRVLIEALHIKTEELLTFVQRDAAAFDEFMVFGSFTSCYCSCWLVCRRSSAVMVMLLMVVMVVFLW